MNRGESFRRIVNDLNSLGKSQILVACSAIRENPMHPAVWLKTKLLTMLDRY